MTMERTFKLEFAALCRLLKAAENLVEAKNKGGRDLRTEFTILEERVKDCRAAQTRLNQELPAGSVSVVEEEKCCGTCEAWLALKGMVTGRCIDGDGSLVTHESETCPNWRKPA